MASYCVTPDSLPDIYNRILTLNDQNQTPIKLGKRSSRVKEKDSYCLCCGTNLYGVGSIYNTKTCDGLASKVSKLLNCVLDFNRQSCRVCKTCFRRVESLDKRVSVYYHMIWKNSNASFTERNPVAAIRKISEMHAKKTKQSSKGWQKKRRRPTKGRD